MSEDAYSPSCPVEDFYPCSPDILDQHTRIKKEIAAELLNSVPNPAFILNSDRRIILYNSTLSAAAGERRTNKILGRRPGELFRCCNSQNSECGKAVPCVQCGALRAIQTAMTGEKAEEICMLLSNVDGIVKAYTFKVNASPLVIKDEQYFIIHLTDISDSKHKEMMERVFLHDLLNAVNGIVNAGTLLEEDAVKTEHRELAGMIVDRARFMANEIDAHRLFISAEARQLEVNNEPVIVKQIIDAVCALHSSSQMTKDKNISLKSKIDDFSLTTDKRILYRIIENLVKNAIEASPANSTVEVMGTTKNDYALITVSNTGTIPMTVAHQIFKKSFSTKGKGRGLGTYSVKVFTENYLRGRVWFDSSQDDGTNFYVKIPLSPSTEPIVEQGRPQGLQN
ncbi:PAS domain-containing sensor histidine kinase [Maridesulfovibrio salexigens]|uniref:Histidine kinase n=1 Tax=Maridesulfovibrio salexigens (strain ATCC 14822 / DSM 2638 / NCIMB 8403 / VKM B-1763) TaxID=526222 RepID=C6BRV5_MARSD|nr:PAS domain-containing sensor histidine kinase [Maridesulfovibrio salexigens]ACS81338.1 histidine kinase [Maridesulfovibrio salexigens DSM 2638]